MAVERQWPARIDRRSLKKGAGSRKMAEVLAERIEDEIREKGWPVGTVLGSEPELLERFGVSRAVFREAIRLVENHRVARMRRGPNGGLWVIEPEAGSLARAAALFLDFHRVTADDLVDTRVAVELAAVEYAVQRLDEDGIQQLRDALAVEGETMATADWSDFFHGTPHDIHVLLGKLSGNPAIGLFVGVLVQLTTTDRTASVHPRPERSKEEQDRVAEVLHRAHAGIVEAVVQGDSGLAKHRMRLHLEGMRGWLR